MISDLYLAYAEGAIFADPSLVYEHRIQEGSLRNLDTPSNLLTRTTVETMYNTPLFCQLIGEPFIEDYFVDDEGYFNYRDSKGIEWAKPADELPIKDVTVVDILSTHLMFVGSSKVFDKDKLIAELDRRANLNYADAGVFFGEDCYAYISREYSELAEEISNYVAMYGSRVILNLGLTYG